MNFSGVVGNTKPENSLLGVDNVVSHLDRGEESTENGVRRPYLFPMPSASLLHAAWYKELYPLDSEVQKYLACSLFTNALNLEEIWAASFRTETAKIVPRANLLLLSMCGGEETNFERHFVSTLSEFINCTLELLKKHVSLALVSRVGVSMHAGATITPAQLLGLSDAEEVRLVPALTCDIRLTPSMENAWTWNVPQLCYRSNNPDEAPAYYKELESVEVSEKKPVALRRGAPGDAFDHLLKVFDLSALGGYRYIAVNSVAPEVAWKMKEGVDRRGAGPRVRFPYKNGAQAATFCDAMRYMVEPVTYVYLTNHPQDQCVKTYVSEDRTKQREGVYWVYAGRQELQKFMGPMWDVHRAYRTF
eukprot:gene15429-17647_t